MFGKSDTQTAALTLDEQIAHHWTSAESAIDRAGKLAKVPGDAQTRVATLGTGHAVLALLLEQKRTNELLTELLHQHAL